MMTVLWLGVAAWLGDAVVIAAGRKTARIALLMLGALREVSVRCDALAQRGAQ